MSNASEFAAWFCKLHFKPCHVLVTNYQTSFIKHYVFSVAGRGVYLLKNYPRDFFPDNFAKMHAFILVNSYEIHTFERFDNIFQTDFY